MGTSSENSDLYEATGQRMPWVSHPLTSADPDGADLCQPDHSRRVVSVRTPDGPAWGGVPSVDAFLHVAVDYCSYIHRIGNFIFRNPEVPVVSG